ncbi:MAG: hypothetical protein COA62_04255 [Rhodobiaceae bacterium]|nr:MAG: hypothetical protein COA62_04255 [Rhodobiaceae bacterium]
MKNSVSKVPQIRLLPSVIICATALLALKLVGLGIGLEAIVGGVQPAYAQAPAVEEQAAEGEHGEMSEGSHDMAEMDEAPAMDVVLTPEDFDRPSAAERNLLRSLSERRKELDARERDIALQGRLLEATERRVETRIDELKEIEARIESLFGVHDEAQEQQLASLVIMYQSMKPKDAARILGQLDMDILIQVVRRMSERKMAPILAAMDPVAAQELTVELATGGRIPDGFDMTAVLEEAPPAP